MRKSRLTEAQMVTILREGDKGQAIAIPPEYFYQIATSPTEDEDVTVERIGIQFLLNDAGHAIKASPHICHPGNDPNPGSARQCDHSNIASSTSCRAKKSGWPSMTKLPRGDSMRSRQA